jgi:hypothetical protein
MIDFISEIKTYNTKIWRIAVIIITQKPQPISLIRFDCPFKNITAAEKFAIIIANIYFFSPP